MSDFRPERLRHHFSIAEDRVYLDHAAVAPLPTVAVDRMAAVAREVGRHGSGRWEDHESMCEIVRGRLARLLTAEEDEVAFVPNTSAGLSIVAHGLDWRDGDSVVGAGCEFPANVYPWMRLTDRGVTYRQVPERDGRVDLDELLNAVDESTRVLALSWVEYASGQRFDVERIGRFCRERGVLFVVDAIQGLGALDLDVERDFVDVVAAGAHKWLLGPQGIGVLFVSRRLVERLVPPLIGWRSVASRTDWTSFDPTLAAGARRFEPGTFDVAAITALGASLELLDDLEPAARERRVVALAERVEEGLRERGFEIVGDLDRELRSGIVAAHHADIDTEELHRRLGERGVDVAHRAGRLRVSPHVWNTESEIDAFLTAVDGVLETAAGEARHRTSDTAPKSPE